jgi:hypothetical protein
MNEITDWLKCRPLAPGLSGPWLPGTTRSVSPEWCAMGCWDAFGGDWKAAFWGAVGFESHIRTGAWQRDQQRNPGAGRGDQCMSA